MTTANTNWEKMNGTFNFNGALVTKLSGNTWVWNKKEFNCFGAVVIAIQAAQTSLMESLHRGNMALLKNAQAELTKKLKS